LPMPSLTQSCDGISRPETIKHPSHQAELFLTALQKVVLMNSP